MIRDAGAASSPATPLLVGTLLAAGLTAPLVVVLDRIGVPALVLLGLSAGIVLVVTLAAGASGGTMRLPLFLTGGRRFGGFALGLAFAALVPALLPPGQALPAAAALVLVVLVGAPAFLRSGAVSLPTFLAARYGGRALRALSAVLVAGAGLVLGAGQLARAASVLAEAVPPLGPLVALTLCTLVPAAILVVAGTRGLVRAAVVGGCLGIVAALVVLALRMALPGSGPLVPVAALSRGTAGEIVAIVALIFALPFQAPVATAAATPGVTREAAVWAAIAVVVCGVAALPGPAAAPVFSGVATTLSAVLTPLAAAAALLASAGIALGYDAPGERDRQRVSTSRRFAQVRLAMLVVCLAAAILASWRAGAPVASWKPLAEAVLVAGVLPPVLLTLIRPSAGAGAGGTALLLGLAAAALAYDPRVWPGGAAPISFALAGLAAGLVGGLLVSLVAPASRPIPDRGDAAL